MARSYYNSGGPAFEKDFAASKVAFMTAQPFTFFDSFRINGWATAAETDLSVELTPEKYNAAEVILNPDSSINRQLKALRTIRLSIRGSERDDHDMLNRLLVRLYEIRDDENLYPTLSKHAKAVLDEMDLMIYR